MKRLTFFIALLLGALLRLSLPTQAVQAATSTPVTIEHTISPRGGPRVPGANAQFQIYDLTPTYQAHAAHGQSLAQLASKLGALDNQAIMQYVAKQKLAQVSQVTTDTSGQAHFTVNGDWGRAYLVVQTTPGYDPQNALAVHEQSLPMVFSFPIEDQAQGITLATKAISTQRAIYFYKYGKESNTPLQGAVFAIRRADDRYLYQDGSWRANSDSGLMTFTSDKQGLVLLKDLALQQGQYTLQEINAPKGYQITQAAKHIAVVVPRADSGRAITVNGAALRPLLADRVQRQEVQRQALRVTNTVTPTPSTAVPPRLNHYFPQTGEAKLSIALLGFIIIGISIVAWKKKHQYWE